MFSVKVMGFWRTKTSGRSKINRNLKAKHFCDRHETGGRKSNIKNMFGANLKTHIISVTLS